jgi:hypothetical protein
MGQTFGGGLSLCARTRNPILVVGEQGCIVNGRNSTFKLLPKLGELRGSADYLLGVPV